MISLLRVVGIEAARRGLVQNSRLHSAWQAAVRQVGIYTEYLSDRDIELLKKLVNLERLTFVGPSSPQHVALWSVVSSVSPALLSLTSLVFDEVAGGFGILRTVAGLQQLATNLRRLQVSSCEQALDTEDLWALTSLRALRDLGLTCKAIYGGKASVGSIISKLAPLEVLQVHVSERPSEGVLSIFPGSIKTLTSLQLDRLESEGDAASQATLEQDIISAISSLQGLRELHTNYPIKSAEAQQQALAQLKKLTHLSFTCPSCSTNTPEFIVLDELPELVHLYARFYSIADPFEHPSLERLIAGKLDINVIWGTETPEQCKISELQIISWPGAEEQLFMDFWLFNAPRLPRLRSLLIRMLADDGRYRYLAAFLRKQASTLEDITLQLNEPFKERLPKELPACTQLLMQDKAVGVATLQLLGMCSMPVLHSLQLQGDYDDSMYGHMTMELEWLQGLAALQRLSLSDVRANVLDEVKTLLQGKDVQMDWEPADDD